MQVDDTNNVNYIMSFGLPFSTKSKVIHRSSIYIYIYSVNIAATTSPQQVVLYGELTEMPVFQFVFLG